MSSSEVSFLSFLETINPDAAQIAKKMEDLLFEDPSSSIIKARVYTEEILNEVFKQEKLEAPYQSTLYDKILLLTREGYITRDIQQAFDTIRMSGNKAAHNAQFNDITVAFKLHKEMYKIAVWFYEVYSTENIRIPAYEIPKPKQRENIQDLVKKEIMDILGSGMFGGVQKETPKIEEEKTVGSLVNNEDNIEETPFNKEMPIFDSKLDNNESYLLRELRRLKDSSQEAIENANQFSRFKKYLHVDRKIQLDLEKVLETNKDRREGNLILLCGSVGDGKSHLLAYLKENKSELIHNYTIFNDATESFSPNKNAMETLEEVLRSFSDQNIESSEDKVILAINMGVLHNFITTEHKEYKYTKLKQFVERSELFSENITTYYSDETFDLLSFGDYHSYELTEKGPVSHFYSSLLKKVTEPIEGNPFFLALKEDEKNKQESMVHENYRFLQNEFVQDQIVQLVIQTIVKKKLVISARAFLNFVADILIPDRLENVSLMSEFEMLRSSLPNLLFNRKDRSSVLNALSIVDPLHRRSVHVDELVVKLNTLEDWDSIIKEYIEDDISTKWLEPFMSKSELTDHSFNMFFESFIRITFLTNKGFASNVEDRSYSRYLKSLYYFNKGDRRSVKRFYEEIKTSIYKWKGSPKKDYIYINKPTEKFRLSQKLNLKPTIDHIKPNAKEVIDSFKSSILLAYHNGNSDNKIILDIDFPLYSLLTKVQEGYRPNKKDEEDAIKFVEFIDKLMAFGEKKRELVVHFPNDNKQYVLKKDEFEDDIGAFVFEKE
jgi:DNA phosphorothioation-dependent restriction protein DptF